MQKHWAGFALLLLSVALLAQQPLEAIRVHEHQPLLLPEDYRQPILATVFVDPDMTPPVQHRFASHPASETPEGRLDRD